MKDKNHLGFRIKELRRVLGLTQVEFGERLGRSKRSIQEWESGRNEPSERVIRLIEKIFSVNPRWLREGEGEMFLPRSEITNKVPIDFVLMPVPLISESDRGIYPAISESNEVRIAWVPRKKAHHRMFFFKVTEDSMKPRLEPGDWLLADLDSSVTDGDIVLVETFKKFTNGKKLLLRRFHKKGNVIILESYNPDYHPVIVKFEQIRLIAKVAFIIPGGENW